MRTEPRWPVALTILVILALLILLPSRVRVFPPWLVVVLGLMAVGCVVGAATHTQNARWASIERWMIASAAVLGGAGALVTLRELIYDMIHGSKAVDGLQMLSSSIAIWAVNVTMFSLFYWQLDRGGPFGRAHEHRRPDWLFPQDQAPPEDLPPHWRPQFIDYLFLGFSTATAFSTTDALPLTGRAKFAMMSESAISLVTLVVVAARAINVLGA